MHSWVFRNRARLKAIFGPPPAPPRAASTPEGRRRERRRLAGTRTAERGQGTVDRGARHVLLRPMPPPDA